ncbi:hypothetical protein OA512_00370 [SAR86 cluster bacterium]|nr:hypothetical protein [SAR86 cluster bacterium]
MSILFAASEVGSVRSLLPLIQECKAKKIDFKVTELGNFLENEIKINKNFVYFEEDYDFIKEKLNQHKITKVIFSVNIFDTLPLSIARVSQELNIETFHVLDYWYRYRYRMRMDGKKTFTPTKFFVPDEYAYFEALKEGIPKKIIYISGQPGFSNILADFKKNNKKKETVFFKNKNKEIKIILFISEPISDDKEKRGYTEEDSLNIFVNSFRKITDSSSYYIYVMPHPRESIDKLKKTWKNLGGEKFGHVESDFSSFEMLSLADGIVGMSSTFLYKAWLLRFPILSLRPNNIASNSLHYTKRENILSITDDENSENKILNWLKNLKKINTEKVFPRKEINMHSNSVKKIFELL